MPARFQAAAGLLKATGAGIADLAQLLPTLAPTSQAWRQHQIGRAVVLRRRAYSNFTNWRLISCGPRW